MDKKCTKYEGLFTFANKEDFENHLANCQDCRQEHQKMEKISSLIQEVKPYYKKRRRNKTFAKVAFTLLLLFFCGTTFTFMNFNTDLTDTLKYGSALDAQDLGFPVDSYGLITVE